MKQPQEQRELHDLIVLVLPPGAISSADLRRLAERLLAELAACATDVQPILPKPWQLSFLLRGNVDTVNNALDLITDDSTAYLVARIGSPFATSALAGPLRWLQARERSR